MRRESAGRGGWKPFLHHVTKSGPQRRRTIKLKTSRPRPKVLTAAEVKSGRFHTVQALIPGTSALAPVTVGLVGFHMYLPNIGQGVWATFAQIDNAPLQSETAD